MKSALIALICLTATTHIVRAQSYTWSNAATTGGGYITGLVSHPSSGEIYARSDVGGAYRWDGPAQRWIPLMDSFDRWSQSNYKVESIAIAPSDSNMLVAAVGRSANASTAGAGPGGIYRSSNKGGSWTKITPSNWPVWVGADDDKRWTGERLAVHPQNTWMIVFGTRNDGLYRTVDGGANWSQFLFGTRTAGYGVNAVLFDPNVSGRVYASVLWDGLYVSNDNAASWSKVAGGPTDIQRMAFGGSTLFVTAGTGVYKYYGSTWSNISPTANTTYTALAARDSNNLVVSEGEKQFATTYFSSNGGSSWSARSNMTFNIPWYAASSYYSGNHWPAAAIFERGSNAVWVSNWFGTMRNPDVSNASNAWAQSSTGQQTTVVYALASPSSGTELFSGHLDIDGFRHNNGLSSDPSTRFGTSGSVTADANSEWQETVSIAFCESNPSVVARAVGHRGAQQGGVMVSTDGGANWNVKLRYTGVADYHSRPWRVAIARNNSQNIVMLPSGGGVPRYTTNGGTSWSNSTAPDVWHYWASMAQPLASDTVRSGTFYLVDYWSGKFYRSVDGGATFSQTNAASLLPSTEKMAWVQTVPGVQDEVWVGFPWRGVYRSVDGGMSFTKLTTVGDAHAFAFGKADSSGNPALYLYGSTIVSGTETFGIWRSTNRGSSWTRIDVSSMAVGDVGWDGAINTNVMMAASRQTFGTVFLGTGGRGISVGRDTGQLASPVVLTGSRIDDGTGGYSSTTTADKAVDGNTSTFYCSANASSSWVGIDQGATSSAKLTKIRLFPAAGYEYRLNGGKIQGSNSLAGPWTDVFTVPSTPASNTWYSANVVSNTAYRYFRYYTPTWGYCTVAEVEFTGVKQ